MPLASCAAPAFLPERPRWRAGTGGVIGADEQGPPEGKGTPRSSGVTAWGRRCRGMIGMGRRCRHDPDARHRAVRHDAPTEVARPRVALPRHTLHRCATVVVGALERDHGVQHVLAPRRTPGVAAAAGVLDQQHRHALPARRQHEVLHGRQSSPSFSRPRPASRGCRAPRAPLGRGSAAAARGRPRWTGPAGRRGRRWRVGGAGAPGQRRSRTSRRAAPQVPHASRKASAKSPSRP